MMSPRTIYQRRLAAFVAVAVASATLTACVWPNHRYYVYPRPIHNSGTQTTSPQSHYAPDTPGYVPQQQASGDLRYRQVPVTYEQSIRAGYVLLDGGNYVGAVQTFRDTIEMKPWLPDAWYHLACAFNRWADSGSMSEGEDPVDLRDRALGALDQAVIRGWTDLEHMGSDPDLESIRHTAEYRQIALRVHRQLGHEAYIGISADDLDAAGGRISGTGDFASGVVVRHVDRPDNSQGALLGPDPNGLQPGDVIVAFDLMPIRSLHELRTALATKRPSDVVALQVVRNGQVLELTFMLGARPGAKNRYLPTRPQPDPQAMDTERPRVTSVDPATGYVVINRGSEQGVETGQVLSVTRAGHVQAQVEVLETMPWRSHGRVIRTVPDAEVVSGDSLRPATISDAGVIADAIAAHAGQPTPPVDDRVAQPDPPAQPAPDTQPTQPQPEVDRRQPDARPEAQPAPESEAVTGLPDRRERTVSVQDLIDMADAGLSDQTLVAMINASRVDALSADHAIHQLRAAGMSDRVLAAIRLRMARQD